jgi:hypothetical protein
MNSLANMDFGAILSRILGAQGQTTEFGAERPFWERRAQGVTNSPIVNSMFLEKDGHPQTIFSGTHPLADGRGILFPTIRWRSPGLERLSDGQAMRETMAKKDYLIFPNLDKATEGSKSLSSRIRRPNSG